MPFSSAVIFADTVAVLALSVSLCTVLYVRRGVLAAEKSDARDAQRRHDELTPRFEARLEGVNGGQWTRLVLMLLSDTPLTTVRVYLPEAGGVEFTGGQNGVAPDACRPVLQAEALDRPDDLQGNRSVRGMLPGDSRMWRVAMAADRVQKLPLRIVATLEQEEWVVPNITVDSPPDLLQSIW